MTVRTELIQAIGIDLGKGFGQLRLGLVVIDDDHVQPRLRCRRQGLERHRPTVDRDDQRRPFSLQLQQRGCVGAIAFFQAVGNINGDLRPRPLQETLEQRRRGRAVHVVIAEDGDAFPRPHRACYPRCGLVHVFQMQRVRQMGFELGVQECLGIVEPDSAPGQYSAQHLGHP